MCWPYAKDHTIAQAYQQIARIQELGFIYDAHMMTGIAGHGRGQEMPNSFAAFLTALSRAGSSIFLSFCTEALLYTAISKKAPLLQQMSWKIYKRSAAYWNSWAEAYGI